MLLVSIWCGRGRRSDDVTIPFRSRDEGIAGGATAASGSGDGESASESGLVGSGGGVATVRSVMG